MIHEPVARASGTDMPARCTTVRWILPLEHDHRHVGPRNKRFWGRDLRCCGHPCRSSAALEQLRTWSPHRTALPSWFHMFGICRVACSVSSGTNNIRHLFHSALQKNKLFFFLGTTTRTTRDWSTVCCDTRSWLETRRQLDGRLNNLRRGGHELFQSSPKTHCKRLPEQKNGSPIGCSPTCGVWTSQTNLRRSRRCSPGMPQDARLSPR